LKRRSRKLFERTETELNAIAREANIGFSRMREVEGGRRPISAPALFSDGSGQPTGSLDRAWIFRKEKRRTFFHHVNAL
jgi:hypothetical protein